MAIKVHTIDINDTQESLVKKLNYNFHLLNDYIDGVKRIEGERGDDGVPGPQGVRGEKGDKGDSIKYCPYSYIDDPDSFEEWCVENDVKKGSVVLDSEGKLIGFDDDAKPNNTTADINSIVEESITTLIEEKTDIFAIDGDGPIYVKKYKDSNYNKGIILSQNYDQYAGLTNNGSYLSLYRYATGFENYTKNWHKESMYLNGIHFGINNDGITGSFMSIKYDSFTNSISECVIDNSANTSNSGYRFILNSSKSESSVSFGGNDYISLVTGIAKTDINYINSMCLQSGENSMLIGYGNTSDSTTYTSVIKTNNDLIFSINNNNTNFSNTFYFNSIYNDDFLSVSFERADTRVTFGSKNESRNFVLSSGLYGSSLTLTGGSIPYGKIDNHTDATIGSVVIQGGSVDVTNENVGDKGESNKIYGGSVYICGGSSNTAYADDISVSESYGPIFITSGIYNGADPDEINSLSANSMIGILARNSVDIVSDTIRIIQSTSAYITLTNKTINLFSNSHIFIISPNIDLNCNSIRIKRRTEDKSETPFRINLFSSTGSLDIGLTEHYTGKFIVGSITSSNSGTVIDQSTVMSSSKITIPFVGNVSVMFKLQIGDNKYYVVRYKETGETLAKLYAIEPF